MISIAARRFILAGRRCSSQNVIARALSASSVSSDLSNFSRLEPMKWFSEFTDPAVRGQMNRLREIENELVSTMTEESESVRWDEWEKSIKYPGLVRELREIHESMTPPDIEAEKSRLESAVKEVFAPIIAEFEKLAVEAEKETAELEKRAGEVTYLRDNLDELTVDEFLEKYPSVKASIEDDIANNRWFIRE